jgi:hypothetical protein
MALLLLSNLLLIGIKPIEVQVGLFDRQGIPIAGLDAQQVGGIA